MSLNTPLDKLVNGTHIMPSRTGNTYTNSTNVAPSTAGKTQTVFIHKLYDMLHDPTISHLIWWAPLNDSFCLLPGEDFSKVLAQYFKHTNIASFIRQLNMYGFHKVNDTFQNQEEPNSAGSSISGGSSTTSANKWEFRHSTNQFRKGDVESLKQIKRRSSKNINSHKEVVNLKSLPPTSQPNASSPSAAPVYHPEPYPAPYFIYGDDEGSLSRSRAGSSESLQIYQPQVYHYGPLGPTPLAQAPGSPGSPAYTRNNLQTSQHSHQPLHLPPLQSAQAQNGPHLPSIQNAPSGPLSNNGPHLQPPIHHPIPTPPPQQLHHPHHPNHQAVSSMLGSVLGSFLGPTHGPTLVPEPAATAPSGTTPSERPPTNFEHFKFMELNSQISSLRLELHQLRDKYEAVSTELKRTQSDTMQILEILERHLDDGPTMNANIFNREDRKTPVNKTFIADNTSPMSGETKGFRGDISNLKSLLTQRMTQAPPTIPQAYYLNNTTRNPSNSNIQIVPQHYSLNPHYTIFNAAKKLLKDEGGGSGRHQSVLMDPLQPAPTYEGKLNEKYGPESAKSYSEKYGPEIGKSYSPLSAGKNGYPFPNMARSQSEDGFRETVGPAKLNTQVFNSVTEGVNPRTNSLPLIDRQVRTPEVTPSSTAGSPYYQSADKYLDRSVHHAQRNSFTALYKPSHSQLPPASASTLPPIQKMALHADSPTASTTSSPLEARTMQLPSVGELDKSLKSPHKVATKTEEDTESQLKKRKILG